MVLIEVRNSDGIVGRCDAKCYNAKCHTCTCICGGANHGVGISQAMNNTRQHAKEWLENYKEENNLPSTIESTVNQIVNQLSLF